MTGAPWPPGFTEGVRLFNARRFFEAHEAFEELLDDVETDRRWDLLVALVQVAVGYHKATSSHPGVARMLTLGREKLSAFPAVAWGLDVEALRARIAEDLAALAAGTFMERMALDPPRLVMKKRAR
jgi:predicted metal-dependent hydrolase